MELRFVGIVDGSTKVYQRRLVPTQCVEVKKIRSGGFSDMKLSRSKCPSRRGEVDECLCVCMWCEGLILI